MLALCQLLFIYLGQFFLSKQIIIDKKKLV